MVALRSDKSPRSPRVVWTDAEKSKIVSRAVDVQAEHPDLAGLPLLRVAMQVLPPSRRRRLIAVTQAPFFEPGVVEEVRRRTVELRDRADLIPIVEENARSMASINASQQRNLGNNEGWRNDHEEWRHNHEDWRQDQTRLLNAILDELRVLNSKLGQAVPVQAPYEYGDHASPPRRRRS